MIYRLVSCIISSMATLSPTNFVCEGCGSSSAHYFCLCQSTVLHMCPPCAYDHSSKSHCPLRLLTSLADASDEITRSFEAKRLSSCYCQLREVLKLNESKVHFYGKYLEDVRGSLMREVEEWYCRAREEMQYKAEQCWGHMEQIRGKIERMERRELPEDVFEETLSTVSPTNVREIADQLVLFEFTSAPVSLLSLLSLLPQPFLRLPSTIGQKHLLLSYENRLIPIVVHSTDPGSLISTIKQVLCLQEDPIISPVDITPTAGDCGIRHGARLRVDCDVEVNLEGEKTAKITMKRKETVRVLLSKLAEMWRIEESRIHLYLGSEELQESDAISAFGHSASVLLRCEVRNMLILKQKLTLQRFEVMYSSSDTPLDLKLRTGLPSSTPLHLNSALLKDHFPLSSQGVLHLSILEYDLVEVETCEVFVVLTSGKRKVVTCANLHLGVEELWKRLVELKAVRGEMTAVKFVFEGLVVQKGCCLDDLGVKNKSILQLTRT